MYLDSATSNHSVNNEDLFDDFRGIKDKCCRKGCVDQCEYQMRYQSAVQQSTYELYFEGHIQNERFKL